LELDQENFATGSGQFFENFSFASPIPSAVDLSRMRFYAAGVASLPPFAFLEDGGLLGIYDISEGNERVRFVNPRKGWGNIEHAVSMQFGSGRERRGVLVTL